MGQLPVQDWLLLLYQDFVNLSFLFLHLFCKLFANNALHLLIQRFRSVIAACNGVECAADLLLQGELRQPESGDIFHAEMPVLIEIAVVAYMVGRQGLRFEIGVRAGKIIFCRLIVVGFFP